MAVYLQDRLYAKTHEWVKVESLSLAQGDIATSGISDYAQEELNDVVYVELPEVGDSFSQGDSFAVIESVKAASDVYVPLSGEIIEVNRALEDKPQLINEDPYGAGWLIKFRVRNSREADSLLDATAYQQLVEKGG